MDAIFLARGLVEKNANALQESPLILLALDWAKAFDSICPQALVESLKRFGVTLKMLHVIESIYTNRVFCVAGAGVTSEYHEQKFGICQGCPLSPFLFGG